MNKITRLSLEDYYFRFRCSTWPEHSAYVTRTVKQKSLITLLNYMVDTRIQTSNSSSTSYPSEVLCQKESLFRSCSCPLLHKENRLKENKFVCTRQVFPVEQ